MNNYPKIMKENNFTEIFYLRYKRYCNESTLCFRSIRNILPTIRTPTNHRANQPLKTRSKASPRMWWEENQLGRLLYTRCSRWLSKTSVLTSKGGADGGDISGALRAVASIASVSIVKAVIVPAHPGYMRARVQGSACACECTCPGQLLGPANAHSAIFCPRNTVPAVSHGRVYPRSQLSRPSFSSRSNNNNHYLFAYITPGPTSRIKFVPSLRAPRTGSKRDGDLRVSRVLNTSCSSAFVRFCCVAIFLKMKRRRIRYGYFFLNNCGRFIVIYVALREKEKNSNSFSPIFLLKLILIRGRDFLNLYVKHSYSRMKNFEKYIR